MAYHIPRGRTYHIHICEIFQTAMPAWRYDSIVAAVIQAWRCNRTVAEANRFSGIPIRTRSGTRMYGRVRKHAKPATGVVPATYPAAKTGAWHCGISPCIGWIPLNPAQYTDERY
jgi:hypothetical protein